ncbi:hypothetical protein [Streptomyces sp. WAC06614]|uniref:hypothetical protein n=1 Tax=Streptomyces sp. WAC06614 TaxID=2487416 RepID=UPI000F77EBE6|nr:hypothetical protein [Streptomyces sp. WAC06614]RSS84497.1 hypothetical protein EF918_00265 [Streptomyces sp. WAC06614]
MGAAAAAALALGLVAATTAAAYAEPAPLPAYRTAEGSKKIAGAPSTADAPLVEAGRTYEDTVAPGERYYKLVLDDRSSVYVSAVIRPAAGAKLGYSDGIEVEVLTTAGRRCPGNPGRADFAYEPVPAAAAGVRRLEEDADCQQAGVYYVKLTRTAGKDEDQRPYPVELRVQREPGLRTGNAPAPAPSYSPTAPAQEPAAQAVTREGGTGFNDARALRAGVWRDDLRPGQTRFYRVPLDWGQQMAVTAELAGAKMTKSYGSASGGLFVDLYTPYRALAGAEDTSYDGRQAAVKLPLTAPVAYPNRFASDTRTRAMRVAGWYYLAVTMGHKVGEFTEDATPVPLTLRLTVEGRPVAAPPYVEDLAAGGLGVAEADRAAARDGLTAPEAVAAADRSARMGLVAAGGFGTGTALLLGLGGWLLLARRAAAAAAAAASAGRGPTAG